MPQWYSYARVDNPLGVHLSNMQDNIFRGEYVATVTRLSLLHRELLADNKPRQSKHGNAMSKRPRVARTWENWEAALMIYVGVIAQAYSDSIKYMDIIMRACNTFGGMAWFNSD